MSEDDLFMYDRNIYQECNVMLSQASVNVSSKPVVQLTRRHASFFQHVHEV